MSDETGDPLLDSPTAIASAFVTVALGFAVPIVAGVLLLWLLVTNVVAMPRDYRAAHGERATFVARSSTCEDGGCTTRGDVRLRDGRVLEDVSVRDVTPVAPGAAAPETEVRVVRHDGRYDVHGRDAAEPWRGDLRWAAFALVLLAVEAAALVHRHRAAERDTGLVY